MSQISFLNYHIYNNNHLRLKVFEDGNFDKDEVQDFVNNKNFINADILMISDRYTKGELKWLREFIKFLKNRKKKVVLTSKSNEYKIQSVPLRTQLDIYLEVRNQLATHIR